MRPPAGGCPRRTLRRGAEFRHKVGRRLVGRVYLKEGKGLDVGFHFSGPFQPALGLKSWFSSIRISTRTAATAGSSAGRSFTCFQLMR